MKTYNLFDRILREIALEINEEFGEVKKALRNLGSFDKLICLSMATKGTGLPLGEMVSERLSEEDPFSTGCDGKVKKTRGTPKYNQ
jgi:hypothetical protein